MLERFRDLAPQALDLSADLSAAWEALEQFPEERASRRSLRLKLWQGWNATLPNVYTRFEAARAAQSFAEK